MATVEPQPRRESARALSLDLKFFPDASVPGVVRHLIEGRFRTVVKDPDLLARVAMVAHEFLENAVKYADTGAAHFTIEIAQDERPPRIAITLSNRAREQHRRELRQFFAEMDSFQDAFEHYNRLLRGSRSARACDASGGLGLARIRAEGEMRLTLTCDEDSRLPPSRDRALRSVLARTNRRFAAPTRGAPARARLRARWRRRFASPSPCSSPGR